MSFASEVGLDIASMTRLLEKSVIVVSDGRIFREKCLDITIPIGWRSTDHLRKSKSRDAIDDSEINRFCLTTHITGDRGAISKKESRRAHVDVFSGTKRLNKIHISRETREDAKLHLRVISYEKRMRRIRWDET